MRQGEKKVMGVERGPEAVGEDHRPGARLRPGARALAAQRPLHFLEQDAQDPTCQRLVAVQKAAQAFRQGQHPLAYRYRRNDVIV